MAEATSQSAPDSWRSDPQADFLSYQLLRLARAVMGEHFDDDTPESSYQEWLRRESRRKGGGQPMVLREWDEHPDRGTLSLTAQPVANRFILAVAHADFTAEVTIAYDIDIEEMVDAAIRHFQGNIAHAIKGASDWFEDFIYADLNDLIVDEDGDEED